MVSTIRDLLSEIATDLRAYNYDDRISFRYIYSKFKSKMDYFLRLESKSREFLRDYTLWKSIKFLELDDYSPQICGMVDSCKTLKISKDEIPELINTFYGKLIRVVSLDDNIKYNLIEKSTYKDHINRPYSKNIRVFWIEDNKIVIPNTTIEAVKVYLIPKDDIMVDRLNNKEDNCKSILDGKIGYPDYLVTLAKQETLKELLEGYKRIIEDENPDDNSNRK